MQRREAGAVDQMFETQRAHFVREWIVTRRYRRLARNAWKNIPALAGSRQGGAGHTAQSGLPRGVPQESSRTDIQLASQEASAEQPDSNFYPVLLETSGSHNIVRFIGKFWAVPRVLGDADLRHEANRRRPGVIVADTLAEVRAAIDSAGSKYEIVLVQEGYKGHNIGRYLGRCWGLPLTLGHVDFGNESIWLRPGVIVADTPAEVRAAIDSAGFKYKILLVQEGYKSHNIVGYLGRFWGLPQALGEVNLEDEAERKRPGVIVADTLAEVRKAIDGGSRKYQAVLVQEGYKAHNIVRYHGRFWGLPKALGEVNLDDEAQRIRPGVIVADTLAKVRRAIDGVGRKYEMVLVKEGYKAHNIVRYLGRYWGLPQALGPVNLEDEAERKRPGVIVADTLPKLRAAIGDARNERR